MRYVFWSVLNVYNIYFIVHTNLSSLYPSPHPLISTLPSHVPPQNQSPPHPTLPRPTVVKPTSARLLCGTIIMYHINVQLSPLADGLQALK